MPTARGELGADVAAVAFPGRPLGAEEGGAMGAGKGFQFVHAAGEFVGQRVRLIPALAVPTEIATQVMVLDAGLGQALLHFVALEMGEASAGWEAADVGDGFDPVGHEYPDELLPRPGAGAKGEDGGAVAGLVNGLGVSHM